MIKRGRIYFSPKNKSVPFLLFLLGTALFLYWYVTCHLATVYVFRLPSGHLFLMEDPKHPALKRFRMDEGLDRIVASEGDELHRLLALAKWTSHLFAATTPFPDYPPWNAAETLRMIRSGETGGFCAQYAIIFGQSCQSLGYQIRYCDLASQDLRTAHFVPEVYLPSRGKWVVFEPQFGSYYEDDRGTPLGVLELHDFEIGSRTGSVLEAPDGDPAPPERIGRFHYFRYYMRNNFLSVPVFYTVRLLKEGLQWKFEEYTPVCDSPEGKRNMGIGGDFTFIPDVEHAEKSLVFSVSSFLDDACNDEKHTVHRIKVPPDVLAEVVKKMLSRDLEFHPLDKDTSWWPVPRSVFSSPGSKKIP